MFNFGRARACAYGFATYYFYERALTGDVFGIAGSILSTFLCIMFMRED